MKITYLYHSGFSLETEGSLLIFDYFKGGLPDPASIPPERPVLFFVSHHHPDHYSTDIFNFAAHRKNTHFILSSDIRHTQSGVNIHTIGPDESMTVCGAEIKTLLSTDCGVAYLVKLDGSVIYHAGDLHLWIWEGAPSAERDAMTLAFRRELHKLEGERIDVAFLPLDPRQGSEGTLGFDLAMRTLDISHAVPMHFWEDAAYVTAYRKSSPHPERIIPLLNTGDSAVI